MTKKHNIYFGIYYCLFVLCSIFFGYFMGSISIIEDINPSYPTKGMDNFLIVLEHNTKNFFMYLICPLLSPIFQLSDFIGSSFQITIGIKILGVKEGLDKLYPYAFFEFPNLILYQGISQYLLWYLVITKSIKKTLHKMKSFLKFYIFSYIILVISALIEGFI